MATGLIGAIASAGTLTYSAQFAAKVLISAATSATPNVAVTVNGVPVLAIATAWSTSSATLYVGAGQTVVIANATGMTSVVSVLEEY